MQTFHTAHLESNESAECPDVTCEFNKVKNTPTFRNFKFTTSVDVDENKQITEIYCVYCPYCRNHLKLTYFPNYIPSTDIPDISDYDPDYENFN